MPNSRLAVAIPALLLLAHLPAQVTPSLVPSKNMIPWPSNVGTGPMRKVVGMFLDDVDLLGALVVRGTGTAHATAPAATPNIESIAIAPVACDAVRLRGAGLSAPGIPGAPNRDAVLVSTLGTPSLRILSTDASGQQVIQSVDLTGWGRATAITARPRGTQIAIAARSSDYQSLLRAHYDLALGQLVADSIQPLGAAIRDIALFDLDGDGQLEAAVLDDNSLEVYDAGGTSIYSRQLSVPGGAIEALEEAGALRSIALLERNAADLGWQLVYISIDPLPTPLPLTIEDDDFGVVAMFANDADDDQDDDVVIQASGTTILVVPNNGNGSAPFLADSVTEVQAGNQGGTQMPGGMEDWTYDGRADFAAPVLSADGKLYLVMLTDLLPDAGQPDAIGDYTLIPEAFHEVEGNPELKLKMNINEELGTWDEVKVRYFNASESVLGSGGFASELSMTAVLSGFAAGQQVTAVVGMPAGDIARENLLLMMVQFRRYDDDLHRLTLFYGATIKDLWPEWEDETVASAFFDSNSPPGSDPKEVKRTYPNGGRQRIGLIGRQYTLPFK